MCISDNKTIETQVKRPMTKGGLAKWPTFMEMTFMRPRLSYIMTLSVDIMIFQTFVYDIGVCCIAPNSRDSGLRTVRRMQ